LEGQYKLTPDDAMETILKNKNFTNLLGKIKKEKKLAQKKILINSPKMFKKNRKKFA